MSASGLRWPLALCMLLPAHFGVTGTCGTAMAAVSEMVVSARADAARIGEGDSVTFIIEASGQGIGQVEDPDLASLADFTIATGPSVSTSSSMVWSGGQATSNTTKRYTYVLLPRRRGTLTIPAIPLKRGSRILHTQPIAIEVVEGNLRRGATARPRTGESLTGPRREANEPEVGEILVEATLDRKEGYVGEQFLLTYKVFTQIDLMEVPAPQQLPAYTGFWVEEIPIDPRATARRVTRDGAAWLEITMMKKVLFPTASGRLTIEETAFGMPVKIRSRDPFEGLFFTPTKTLFRQSQPITVTVKPLPDSGRPGSFSGAVGRYKLTAGLDRGDAQVSDAVGLKITVEGEGNIRLAGPPVLPPLSDFRSYEPKVEEKKSFSGERLHGKRTWEYVLTPLAVGAQSIAPIRFSWFDPAKGTYVEAASVPLPIVVRRGANAETSIASGGSDAGVRREVRAVGRDIAWIKPVQALTRTSRPFHRSAWFAVLMSAPILANTGLLLLKRRWEKERTDSAGLRLRRAPRFARRRLKEARAFPPSGDSKLFHEAVGRAVSIYLGDKLGVSPAGMRHESLEEMLTARGVESSLCEQARACLDRCDFGRYAPEGSVALSRQEMISHAETLIARLERSIGSSGPGRNGA